MVQTSVSVKKFASVQVTVEYLIIFPGLTSSLPVEYSHSHWKFRTFTQFIRSCFSNTIIFFNF